MLHKTLKVCQVDCPLIGNGTSLLIRVQYIFVARKSTKKKINENIEGWKGEATVAGWPHISRQLGLGIYARYAKYVRHIRYSFRCSQIHSFICRNPLQQKLKRIHILQGLAMGILGPTQPYLAKQVFPGLISHDLQWEAILAGGCAQSPDQLHMDRTSPWWLHGGDHHQRCLQVSWVGVARYVIVCLFQTVHLQTLAEVGFPRALPSPLRRVRTPCASRLQLPSSSSGSPWSWILHRKLQHRQQLPGRLHARTWQVILTFWRILPVANPGVLLIFKVSTPSHLRDSC